MLTEKDIKKADATARDMRKKYATSTYTASERAADHAFSYDFGSWGRAYWLAVSDKLTELHNEDRKKQRATA